ncbi:MAG: GlxA family transcriptional regulator [Paracoccaceae bacterium]
MPPAPPRPPRARDAPAARRGAAATTEPALAGDGPAPASSRRIGFIVVAEFSLICLTAAIEPMRFANTALGRAAYDWRLIGPGGTVRASSGLSLGLDLPLDALPGRLNEFDALIVVTSYLTATPHDDAVSAVLRRAARRGLILGSLSAGAFALARAGLLDGYRCTIHWEYQPAFEEAFPDVECSSGLFVIDRGRWTGSGGISSMDMMLHMIAADHGPRIARLVANNFQVDRIRNAGFEQRPGALERLETLPEPVQRVVALMRGHIEHPLGMAEIASIAGLNLRRIERLFQAHLGESPASFYRRLRLERAREILMHTTLSALEAALMTGFTSSSHFAMAYQRQHGIRPSETRRTGEDRAAGR